MTTIVTRTTKGAPLSWAEADANFTNLNTYKLEDTDRPYSDTNPIMDGNAAQGSSPKVSRQDHVHPTDTSRVAKSGDTLTGQLWAAQGGAINTWLPNVQSAVGFLTYRSDKATLAGGCGVYSLAGTTETHAFIGCGTTPWVTGILVDTNGNLTAQNGLTIKPYATGISDGNVFSGTYIPTVTPITNVSSTSVPQPFQYIRVGNTVNISGTMQFIATSTSTETFYEISLPIASNFINIYNASGTGVLVAVTGGGVRTPLSLKSNPTSDLVEISFIAPSTAGNHYVNINFTYVIL